MRFDHAELTVDLNSGRCQAKTSLPTGYSKDPIWLTTERVVGYVEKQGPQQGKAFLRCAIAVFVADKNPKHAQAATALLQRLSGPLFDPASILARLLWLEVCEGGTEHISLHDTLRCMLASSPLLTAAGFALANLSRLWAERFPDSTLTSATTDRLAVRPFMRDMLDPGCRTPIAVVSSTSFMDKLGAVLCSPDAIDVRSVTFTIEPTNVLSVIAELESVRSLHVCTIVRAWFTGLITPTDFQTFLALFRPGSCLRLILLNTSHTDRLLSINRADTNQFYPMAAANQDTFSSIEAYSKLPSNPTAQLIHHLFRKRGDSVIDSFQFGNFLISMS